MGLRINTNTSALNANRQTSTAAERLNQSLQRLASLRRINTAADDASGLAIAERFNTQARQYQVEANNLQAGIAVTRTADGALGAQSEAGPHSRLGPQASNGTLTDDQRQALNAEAQQLIQGIGDIAQDTEYNGQQLLAENTTIDLGTTGSNQVQANASTPEALGIDAIDLSTAAGAQAAVTAADTALTAISENRANLGAQENSFATAINQRDTGAINAAASESAIRDLDVARAATERTRNQLLLQASIGATAQSNIVPQSALQLLGL